MEPSLSFANRVCHAIPAEYFIVPVRVLLSKAGKALVFLKILTRGTIPVMDLKGVNPVKTLNF